ncbi:altronate dehydratase [Bacillus ectoiniformans]|nr:altronate dehydratase [Bacillus ectoiniformans]
MQEQPLKGIESVGNRIFEEITKVSSGILTKAEVLKEEPKPSLKKFMRSSIPFF